MIDMNDLYFWIGACMVAFMGALAGAALTYALLLVLEWFGRG